MEVALPSFSLRLPAYYILASSESSSNLSCYNGVRYGNQVFGDEIKALYGDSRAQGLGSEVKMRILMGTYALSAGYYDVRITSVPNSTFFGGINPFEHGNFTLYKKMLSHDWNLKMLVFKVRTIIRNSFKEALDKKDILISPAAPSVAYKIGEKKNDPLAMYVGDIMTVNVNLAGLPSLVLPCGVVEGGSTGLHVGLQMIGAAFDEEKFLRIGHIFEQTLQGCSLFLHS
ncbi:hypothetical protein ACS0TY_026925 [Phlomoides rotata]